MNYFTWVNYKDVEWAMAQATGRCYDLKDLEFTCCGSSTVLYETHERAASPASLTGGIVIPVGLESLDRSPGRLYGVAKEGLRIMRHTHDDRGVPMHSREPGSSTYCGSGSILFSTLEALRLFYRRKLLDEATRVFSVPGGKPWPST